MELHPFLEEDIRPSPNWWYVLSATGESPSMRVGHSATFVPGQAQGESGRVFIIGGANPSQVFDEVWVLDLATRAWDSMESPGFRGRYEHAAFQVANHPGKIFIFGGATQTGCLNDVQSLDVSTGAWSDVEVSGTLPAPRTHRSAAVVGCKVYFFGGGHSGAEPVSDKMVHCLDTHSWQWKALSPKGNSPKPRHGHVFLAAGGDSQDGQDNCSAQTGGDKKISGRPETRDRNNKDATDTITSPRIYLHGGLSGSTFFDDLHVLDVDKMSWSLVRKKRTSPQPRTAHEGIVHQNSLILFGGMSQTGALDDAHRLTMEGNSWNQLEFESPAPPNRLDFAMCCIKLRVPRQGQAGQLNQEELQEASASTKAVLERELKPGSASSRDSCSDSASVDEALFTMEPGEGSQGQGQQHVRASGATTTAAGEGQDTETEEVDLIFIHGGMDTEGEIFDDSLVLLLS